MTEQQEIIATTEFSDVTFTAPVQRNYNTARNFLVVIILIELIASIIGWLV
ncbi:MAG: hypothetical protein RLZZ367_270 [Bacteroidota bacterium]|jgi:hypothetical protein